MSAIPDHIWHKGDSYVTVSKASGADVVGGYFSCILSKDNYKGRNQKPYIIRFTQPDSAVRYWAGRLRLFIRSKAACNVEMKSFKSIAQNVAIARDAEEDENKQQSVQQPSAQELLRFNGALPMLSTDVIPGGVPSEPPSLTPEVPSVPIVANVNVVQDVLGAQFPIPSVFEVAVDTFDGRGWTASTIGDMRLFAAVCLKVFKAEGKRCGAAKLANKIEMKAPTIDKYLKFIMCLIKKQVIFSEVDNLGQGLDAYSKQVLGYTDYAAVSHKNANNGYSGMKIAQVERLLQ